MELAENALARTDGSDSTAILARVEELGHRQAQGEKLAARALMEEVARTVQSIGIVVDYLASRGLIDKADLQSHIERNFHIAHCYDSDGPDRRAIDVYGWLTWADAMEGRRVPVQGLAPRPDAGPHSHSVCLVLGANADLEAEQVGDRHLDGDASER